MAILLASFSALFYGVADYCGGRATRHATSAAVTVRGQLASVVLIGILLLADWETAPAASDWGWGLLAGLAGGAGLLAFYRAMASGAMTVTAPISAVVGAVVPVVFGFAQGERPGALAMVGIAIAVTSVALVSSSTSARHVEASWRMILMAMASGSCFGLIFVLLSHTSDEAGMWPLLGMRLSSIPTVLVVALVAKKSLAVPRSALVITLASGVLDTLSNGLYLLATRHGMLIIVAVVTALYPVSTVMLATSLDEERVSRSHLLGMVGAGVALVLVSLARV